MEFYNVRPAIKDDDIKSIESILKYPLPKSYRQHLLSYNGGEPEYDVFSFKENGCLTSSRIHYFYAVGTKDYDDLLDVIKMFKLDEKRIPERMLPIAEDPFGNVICISASEPDYGVVYFWDHEKEVDHSVTDDEASDLYLISNSFHSFLSDLKKNKQG